MNSAIVSNINGGVSNQQVANASHSSVLLSSIDFKLTEVKTNFSPSSHQGKYLTKLTGKEDLFNGQNRINCDQNKNSIDNYLTINGNLDKSSEDNIPTPKVQLYTGKINTEWYEVNKIGAGLNNLGNTCFMNTVMQCLTYCPPLANYLMHDNDHSSKCTSSNKGFCMMCLLHKHMKRTIGKTGEVIKPLEVYHRLKDIAKNFQFGQQEDAHEFLLNVIEHMQKNSLTQFNNFKKLDEASTHTTVIHKIFGGYHRSQVICSQCKKKSNTYDYFQDFILDIKQNVSSLERALEKYSQAEFLQNDNRYDCPKCKMKVDAKKIFSVYKPPTVATFQLKRFDCPRGFGGKITKQITYPEKLNLRPYMSEPQGDPVWYRLNAVLVHSGHSCNSGHYYCYVKNSNGFWYLMDDQRVGQVSLNQVLNQSAYVLFYIKMAHSEKTNNFKKCLENKNLMNGSISNTHLVKVSDMSNLKSSSPLSEKNVSLPNSKTYGSPNSMKKLISNQNRDRISFGFRTAGSPLSPVSSPKAKVESTELLPAATTTHSGLVPYVEDSSESSDAAESSPPLNKNNISAVNATHIPKTASAESYCSSPPIERKAKPSKSVFGSPAPSCRVSATESWIVTDVPQAAISSPSSSSGVTSTTNWQVIEASELKQGDSLDKDSSVVPRISPVETTTSKHMANGDSDLVVNLSKESASSDLDAQKCDFRRQPHKNKTPPPSEEEETVGNGSKRKCGDSHQKVSQDSVISELSESRHSPLPKKAKYVETPLFLNRESDVVRNSSVSVGNNSYSDKSPVQRLPSHCDNASRTSLPNGVSSSRDSSTVSLNKDSVVLNGTPEKDRKFSVFSKAGKQDGSYSDSRSSQHQKEKLPISSNQGSNSSLYGTEVPTWRGENHYRPSVVFSRENRRTFDEYDQEFDRGKVRKPKYKDQRRFFHQKNPFQKHFDRQHDKYNSKFYQSRRKYESHHWKRHHNDHYQRYQGYHRYF